MPDLTHEQIFKMEAGPKFNALIATEVMGWEAKHDSYRCDGTRFIRCGACGRSGHGNCYGNGQGAIQITCGGDRSCCDDAMMPEYSTDPSADYEVLVFVRENWEEAKRLSFGLQLSSILDDRWGANDFGDVETAGYYYQPGDYSRAALAASIKLTTSHA